MNEFEEKKKQYYEKVSSYNISSKINFNGFDKGYNLVKTLLNPRTQVEMDFGEAVFQLLDDVSKMLIRVRQYDYDYSDADNEFIRFFSDYVNKVLNDKSLENELFFINFNEENVMNIDINNSALSKIYIDNTDQSVFDYYARVFYDMFYAMFYSDILLCGLSRNNINIETNTELFRNLLSQCINNANNQANNSSTDILDKNKIMIFFTNLFNSFHHLFEEKMKLERKK